MQDRKNYFPHNYLTLESHQTSSVVVENHQNNSLVDEFTVHNFQPFICVHAVVYLQMKLW